MSRSIRSLPRMFIQGASAESPFELPADELKKLRHVLRLSSGAHFAVLPNDGTLVECELRGHEAHPVRVVHPETEPELHLTLGQALPKGDKLDDIVKAGTGIGISSFVLFNSERTVVRWDDKKLQDRLRRLRAIAREESEVSFRTRVPKITFTSGLFGFLQDYPDTYVLSEVEGLERRFAVNGSRMSICVGPEGGWSTKEIDLIGDRGVTLGPRVLRVEHAGPAAAAKLLLM